MEDFSESSISSGTGDVTTSFQNSTDALSNDSIHTDPHVEISDSLNSDHHAEISGDDPFILPLYENHSTSDILISDEDYNSDYDYNDRGGENRTWNEDDHAHNYFLNYFNLSFDSDDNSSDESFSENEFDNNEDIEINEPYQEMINLINSDEYKEVINLNLKVNRTEVMYGILAFAKQYSLPNSATTDLCKMLNSFFTEPIIPDTQYRIDKIYYPKDAVTYHSVCPLCKRYISTFRSEDKVRHCNTCNIDIHLKSPLYKDFFATFDIASEIRNLIEKNYQYYNLHIRMMENRNRFIKDIYDGQKYKKFRRSLPYAENESYVTLTFNSDGSPLFKSSNFSIWPIQAIVNELSFETRCKNPVVIGMWFGPDKPSMTTLLDPIVKYINGLSTEGIMCTINDERINFKVYAVCCCVDTVARAPMQGLKQFNGFYGCNWCLHPGKTLGEIRSVVKYPLLDDVPERRNELNSLAHINEALHTGQPVFGFKKASPLINLKCFNIIDGFVPDAMHCITLGVTKQFFKYWFHTSGHEFSLTKEEKGYINRTILNFKVPKHLARLSRSTEKIKYWKAKEWENWLLFYSYPCLSIISRMKKFLKHWLLLVNGVHLLMHDKITVEQLQRANDLLKEFVSLTQHHYHEYAMTYNVHQLIHVPQSVADWGPLWAHIGYVFESGNGDIIRTVHAAKGVINQISRNICKNRCLSILENNIKLNVQESPVVELIDRIKNRYTVKSYKLNNSRYFGKKFIPTEETLLHLDIQLANAHVYRRLYKENVLYQSCKKICLRSDSSYAQLDNAKFVQIVEFVVDTVNLTQYVICKEVSVEATENFVFKIANVEDELIYVPTEMLKKICVHMQVGRKRFIFAVSNTHFSS
ncbi:hypothetical protein TKK_0010189 [Trichogramma kaykai]|uniref:Transposase domain-containing protein n=1 Tax=Trichogramma kaykai TaxID=54128 RepID=A0ABD2WYD3_9HYME